jgi:hypothetical protein
MGLIDTRTATESIAMDTAMQTGVAVTTTTKVVAVRINSSQTCYGVLDGAPHTESSGADICPSQLEMGVGDFGWRNA